MIRWIFRWFFRLLLLAALAVVVVLVSLNSIIRIYLEHTIRARTGMDAEIGRFELGWFAPTIEIQNLRLYNPASFGGTPFLNVPEIHIEYNRAALAMKEIHLTLLRVDVAELDIVKGENGRTNIFEIARARPAAPGNAPAGNFKAQTGYDFTGIDALNVSFQKAEYIDLQNPRDNRTQVIGIQNCVVPNVKSANDLAGLAFIIGLRSNHFFDPFIGRRHDSASLKTFLNMVGVIL